MRFSVLMSVYHKDSAEHLDAALASIVRQTVGPNEVVLVEDGHIGNSLRSILDRYSEVLPLVRIALPENRGLGFALSAGLSHCTNPVVARMDADDICVPRRFEVQLRFLKEHPEVAVVGSAAAEFAHDHTVVHSVRALPQSGEGLSLFAKTRNPLNHMTVMFRRSAVVDAGGYKTAHGFEDYHLWARMLVRGYQLHNIEEPLVLVRCGNGMQSRRGGFRYVIQETRLQMFLHEIGFISTWQLCHNLLVRVPVRMVPTRVRSAIYNRLLRRRPSNLNMQAQ
jgi:glycosyltransferase involved in cell wall biosynthesis